MVYPFEVGDGAGEFDEAVVSTGGEAHRGNGLAQEVFAGLVEGAYFTEEGAIHLGIGENSFPFEAFSLNIAGAFDAGADVEAPLSVARGFEFIEGDARDFDVEVDSVHNGTGNAGFVACGFAGRAGAEALGVAEVSAGTGIHRGNEDEARRKMERTLGA